MILVTGNLGYIGSVLTWDLMNQGYQVVGLDTDYYRGCDFLHKPPAPARQMIKDIRDVEAEDLHGISAVIHLAALSNDPLGDLDENLTLDINYRATVRLAEIAKKKGAKLFIFFSSCSLYGRSGGDQAIDENGSLMPLTAYARSKVLSEEALKEMAAPDFHPVFMRNATVFGLSPRLRLDVVVNNLCAWAYLTGSIKILSDGSPWRPLVHVRDVSRAVALLLKAPAGNISGRAFNIGDARLNHRISEIARLIRHACPECRVEIAGTGDADERSYRVSFDAFCREFGFNAEYLVEGAASEILTAFKESCLTATQFEGADFFRIRKINEHLATGMLDKGLRWK